MRRMALRGLVIAACFIPALMVADAKQKMRPPLPKPKPVEIAVPETPPPEAAAPAPEVEETAPPEPDESEAQPDEARSAIVIPREKPAELQKPELEAAPVPEPSEMTAPEPETDEAQPDAAQSAIVIPREKPAELQKPELEAAPVPEPSEMTAPEPESDEAQPDAAQSAIVIPREKPAVLEEPQLKAVPVPEPSEMTAPEPEADEALPDKTKSAAFVIPREKPAELKKVEPATALSPGPRPDATQDDEKPKPDEDFAICRNELAELGAKFKIPEMPAADGKCKVPNPVQITAIASPAGKVDFPGEPILNCIFAKQFTTWVSDVAAPVVKARTGETLAAIATGPGYECRGRNGDGSGKISEHAFGNAIDIASFKLASKESMPVANVAKTDNVESRWLMALRVSACGYFTTVLGPGSNAAHAEHYHFDLGLHGKSGNYRICE